jgi:uncharacterized protein involved in outer membrane biogenesis/vacuolar-type H+-ATPase subunit H
MKLLKRLFLVVFILVIIIIGALAAIPFFYKDQILAFVKEEANKTVNATVDFQDLSLSVFRSFPNLTLGLEGLNVVGIDQFEGIPLVGADALELTVDLMSVISGEGPLQIESIQLRKPTVNVQVLKDGVANYDIAKPTDERITEQAEETDYSGFQLQLKEYSISDGNIVFDDKNGDIYLNIQNLDHSGSGDFTLDVYDLDTQTNIEGITFKQGGTALLNAATIALDAIFNIDTKNSKYTLKDNTLNLNALTLKADGFVQMLQEGMQLDMRLEAPGNDFKSLLSMVPNAYIEGYENVRADGQFNLKAETQGILIAEKEVYPSFKVDLDVDNGNVKYPDLPLGIDNIYTNISVNSPTSELNDLIVDVSRFAVKIGNNPFNAKFRLKTPLSDPDLDAEAKGKIDLDQLSKAFPMEGIEKLSGLITADITAKTRMSYIDQQEYERVKMDGDLQVENVNYQGAGQPPVKINNMEMGFSPQFVAVKSFDANLGASDVEASGRIDNLLAYFSPEKTMTGNLKVRSNLFDLDEWVPETNEPATTTVSTAEPQGEATTEEAKIFDRFDFALDAKVGKIKYEKYDIRNAVAKGRITPQRLEVDALGTEIGDSDLMGSGVLTNIFGFLFDQGTLAGQLNLESGLLNLNQFMTENPADATEQSSTSPPAENMQPIIVPDNLNVSLDTDIDQLLYGNYDLRKIKGRVEVANQAVVLDQVEARGFGGDMEMSGGYDTSDPEKPAFDIKYDLKRLDFGKTFQAVNTFQKLAPIGQYIDGKFTTSLIMSGELGNDMMPKFNTLNAEGFLQTIDGVIKNFKPLQSIGNSLNVQELKEAISLDNTKNWFTIKDGAVEVQPFDYTLKGIDMKIGGRHFVTQEIDYQIRAKVPRKMLESNAVGAAAGQGLDFLQGEASKLGLNFNKSEFVNVQLNLTGALTDPKVAVKFLGLDGETSAGEAIKGEVKAQLDEKVKEGKAAAEAVAKEAIDSAKTVVQEKVDDLKDEAKKKAEQAIKDQAGKFGNQLDTTAKKAVDDILDKTGKDVKNNIEDKLKKFNPFKKKKKKGDGGR